MNKSTKLSIAALALCLAGASAPASADDSLRDRTVAALSNAIADQGNAALVEIRDELKRDLLKTLAPLLPSPPQSRVEPTDPAQTSRN